MPLKIIVVITLLLIISGSFTAGYFTSSHVANASGGRMSSVTVSFLDGVDISSLKVGDNVLVNTIPGVISAKVDPPIPPQPPIIAGDYYPESIQIEQGQLVSGSFISLRLKDTDSLTVTSHPQGVYSNLEWIAGFELPVGTVSGLSLSYRGRYSTWRGQSIFLYDYVNSKWNLVDYRTVGASYAEIYLPSIANPDKYVSPGGQIQVKFYSSSLVGFTGYYDYLKLKVS